MKLFENDWSVYGFTNASDGNAKDEIARKNFLNPLGLDEKKFVCGKQVHEDQIVVVKNLSQNFFQGTDGLATDQTEIILGAFTADCVPVIFTESERRVAAVIHAGWRGTVKGIARKGIKVLSENWKIDLKNLKAHLGPSIQNCCYSVGKEVAELFPSESVQRNGDQYFLGLQETLIKQIESMGIPSGNIKKCDSCTCCGSDFFSYRKNKTEDRMCAFVSLKFKCKDG